MAKRITKQQKDILKQLFESGVGIDYFDPKEVEYLVDNGFIEQNPGMEHEGKLATRLTQKGIEKHESFIKDAEPEVETEVELPWGEPKEEPEEKFQGYVGEVEIEEDKAEEGLPVETYIEPEPSIDFEPFKEEPEIEVVDCETDFEIERNIPIPKRKVKLRGSYKYPFDKLEVGDSFHIPMTDKCPKPARTIASSVSTANKKFDGKVFKSFSVDSTDPKGEGARVFRVE
jgi:hypothetical protein